MCSSTGLKAGASVSVLIDPEQFQLNSEISPAPSRVNPYSRLAVARSLEAAEPGTQAGPQQAWRQEIASKVQAHKARRRRPSDEDILSLDFDESANTAAAEQRQWNNQPSPAQRFEPLPETAGADMDDIDFIFGQDPDAVTEPAECFVEQQPEEVPAGEYQRVLLKPNLIEFPRLNLSGAAGFESELAEPISKVPRILEAEPEQLAVSTVPVSPPVLANIDLDAGREVPEWALIHEESYRDAGFDIPLQVAPLGPRIYSAVLDGVLALTAAALFSVIVMSVARYVPQGKMALLCGAALPALFWLAYQYLFLVYGGITPGMQMAQLELSNFEGCVPSRRDRGRRALAMMVSCISLGMGFAWTMLDEDTLGWHDRITKTYLRQS